MSLKTVFQSLKKEGYIVKRLDEFLIAKAGEDNDRAIDVNAPSQIGKCPRARYYSRTGAPANPGVDPRSTRIFDNGTFFHIRTQEYLKEAGILDVDEVPVYNEQYNIQGHTDGILSISGSEKAVLELKSINSKGFSELKDAKDEHKKQGLTYLFCLENRRQELHLRYKSRIAFLRSRKARYQEYEKLYQHLKGGRKHTREEKIAFQCGLHDRVDTILFNLDTPITKVIFLYENKDTQELKEFVVTSSESQSKVTMESILNECSSVNEAVESGCVPDRCTRNKSDFCCRWCDYSIECWN